jgi:hypothetical protein
MPLAELDASVCHFTRRDHRMHSRLRFPQPRRAGIIAVALAIALGAAARPAAADPIPYPNSGTYNSTTYTFTAASSGDVIAYIVGGFSAGFTNELGLLINGVDTGIYGLNNHTSAVGDSLNFGPATAGDTLTFVLKNLSLGTSAYSDPGLNAGYDTPGVTEHNHVYSTDYTATSPLFPGVPVGTYVAFEDLPFPDSDFNYDDESFVFSNVRADVPEPVSLVLFGIGAVGVAARLRRRARSKA